MALNDIKEWQRRLGLFPVPLKGDFDESGPFVLLNGFKGSFCLALEPARTSDAVRSVAWSSNVGHYVALEEEVVEVRRWDRPGNVERYDLQSINHQLEAFHEHLERDAPDLSSSVISHGILIFRSLRTALGADVSGGDALKVFLFLLASACKGGARELIEPSEWSLDVETVQNALLLSDSDWSSLLQALRAGRPLDRLSVHVDLLLRHSSGLLFQEAHFEALLPPARQLNFEFSVPDPAKLSAAGVGVGLHFTPPTLARTLVEESLAELELAHLPKVSIFDPACGSGEFLRESLRQLRLLRYSGRVELRGWDISDAACSMARFGIAWDIAGDKSVIFDIQSRDSLSTENNWPAGSDIVLMNPPFVSWEDMTEVQRDNMRNVLGSNLKKRPDLSAAFLWKASQSLRLGGVLGAVLPASFFGASSAKELREHLGASFRAKLIARLGSHTLFQGALVDVGLYVAKVDASFDQPPLALWSDYKASSISAALRSLRRARHAPYSSAYPIVEAGFSIYPHSGIGSGPQSWAPRPYKTLQLVRQLSSLPRARDLFDIKQGARTGLNKAFVITKKDWEDLPEGERPFFRPAVLNQSLRDGTLNDGVYIFFPYGDYKIVDEKSLRQNMKIYLKRFLSPYQAELKARSSSPERWWELIRHRNWQVEAKPKLVSAYFGDRGSFAWDSSGKFVVVQGFGWLPRRSMPGRAFSNQLALAYLALLNSQLFSLLLSAVSNNVAGGQWDLSPRFVGDIPLPALQDSKLIADLARIGSQIRIGLLGDVPPADYEIAARAAYSISGLSGAL